MAPEADSQRSDAPSVVHGVPLADEPGLGTLTMPGYLQEVTDRYAESEALVWHGSGAGEAREGGSGAARWSYATLHARADEVARALLACGAGKGTRVGILATNRPELLAAAFGTARAGGVSVLLSTFSTPRELEHLLSLSCVSILLFERHVAQRDFEAVLGELVPAVREAEPGRLASPRLPFLRHVVAIDGSGPPRTTPSATGAVEDWPSFLARGAEVDGGLLEAASASVSPADPGALFFSSGTTSLPKGVLHSHRAVALQWWRWGRLMGMRAPVRSWTANGLFWSGNFSMVVGGTLTSGGSLVLQSTFAPDEALELMEAERVSFALAWPHQWARLEEASAWDRVDLGSLRYVKAETPGARHPTVRTRWLSPPSYGCTETLTISTALASTTDVEDVAGSHGEALPGNTLEIVDPIDGRVVPRGTSGEIRVKGPTLMLGYVGVPLDETLDDEGFFRSGDRGHLDERGRLFFEGRLSDVIKTGGANVSPREIDLVLADCPGVRISQTLGVPHDTLGEMVVTGIVANAGAQLDEDAVRGFARERLASYKVPRRVLFFADDEVERTGGSDKVKPEALRQRILERLAAID